MSEKPENPPAFPRDERYLGHNGMTLRDYFAGQAITVCLKDMSLGYDAWAKEAYSIADAMLQERGQ